MREEGGGRREEGGGRREEGGGRREEGGGRGEEGGGRREKIPSDCGDLVGGCFSIEDTVRNPPNKERGKERVKRK